MLEADEGNANIAELSHSQFLGAYVFTQQNRLTSDMNSKCKWSGNDAIVGNPNSASLRLRGTGKREGGEKTQPFEHL